MKDWSHPRLQNVDAAKDDWDDLAAEAQAAYQRRYASYPGLVKSGRIPAEEARADLLAWRAIARDWHWIAYGDGEPADCNTMEQRMHALDVAVERWIEFAANESGPLFPAGAQPAAARDYWNSKTGAPEASSRLWKFTSRFTSAGCVRTKVASPPGSCALT